MDAYRQDAPTAAPAHHKAAPQTTQAVLRAVSLGLQDSSWLRVQASTVERLRPRSKDDPAPRGDTGRQGQGREEAARASHATSGAHLLDRIYLILQKFTNEEEVNVTHFCG